MDALSFALCCRSCQLRTIASASRRSHILSYCFVPNDSWMWWTMNQSLCSSQRLLGQATRVMHSNAHGSLFLALPAVVLNIHSNQKYGTKSISQIHPTRECGMCWSPRSIPCQALPVPKLSGFSAPFSAIYLIWKQAHAILHLACTDCQRACRTRVKWWQEQTHCRAGRVHVLDKSRTRRTCRCCSAVGLCCCWLWMRIPLWCRKSLCVRPDEYRQWVLFFM